MTMAHTEQLELLNIGRIVEREFPQFKFDTLEELRVHLNDTLGTNIQTGDSLGDVRESIDQAIATKAYNRSMGVI